MFGTGFSMILQAMPYPASIISASDIGVGGFTNAATLTTQQVPSPDLGDATPYAAFFMGTHHEPPLVSTNTAQVMFSAKAQDEPRCVNTYSRNGTTSTESQRQSFNNMVRMNSGDHITNSAIFVPGGMTLNYSAINGTKRLQHVMFAKPGGQASLNSIALGTGTSAIAVNTGFEPDAVIVFGSCGPYTSPGNLLAFSVGVATKNGEQSSIAMAESNFFATGRPMQTLNTTAVAMQISEDTGALVYKVTAGGFSSTGFTLTPNTNAGNDSLFALSLKGYQSKIVPFTTPTVAGDFLIDGAGFRPTSAIIFMTNLEATDVYGGSSQLKGGFATGFVTSSAQICSAIRIQHGVETTNTESGSQDRALIMPSDTSIYAGYGNFKQWTNGGMILDMVQPRATGKKGFVLFLA